jgi:hypothetical protein
MHPSSCCGDDDDIQDFVWQDINNYKAQRENLMGHVAPQFATKQVTKIADVFKLFFNNKLIGKIVEEMNIHTKQFLQGCKLLSKLPATAWKPVTG